MMIDGAKILPIPRAQVWTALNDTAFLQRTIPECRSLSETADGAYRSTIAVGVGPIRANFDVSFTKTIDVPSERFTLAGQGGAGMAGAASGSVAVTLSDVEGGTLLSYAASTEISGKFAQLGARMIDGAARKFSEQFFANVQKELGAKPAGSPGAATPAAGAPAMPAATVAAASSTAGWPAYWLPIGCAIGCFAGTFCANLLR